MNLIREALARPAGFEPATYGLEGRCTILLCYGRIAASIPFYPNRAKFMFDDVNKEESLEDPEADFHFVMHEFEHNGWVH